MAYCAVCTSSLVNTGSSGQISILPFLPSSRLILPRARRTLSITVSVQDLPLPESTSEIRPLHIRGGAERWPHSLSRMEPHASGVLGLRILLSRPSIDKGERQGLTVCD